LHRGVIGSPDAAASGRREQELSRRRGRRRFNESGGVDVMNSIIGAARDHPPAFAKYCREKWDMDPEQMSDKMRAKVRAEYDEENEEDEDEDEDEGDEDGGGRKGKKAEASGGRYAVQMWPAHRRREVTRALDRAGIIWDMTRQGGRVRIIADGKIDDWPYTTVDANDVPDFHAAVLRARGYA
jgi:hypothetical protein